MSKANTITQKTLPNGLRVVVMPDNSVPVVGIAVYYDVGSRNETPGTSGFAHLFEHMMFQGSANVGKAEHFTHIQAWGGSCNGTTSEDRTNYYEEMPSHRLELALWLEADRMRSLAVNEENFENQRQTVMEERRQRVDDSPYGQAMVELGEASYSCWAYAHPVIGYWKDLEEAKLESVIEFHKMWYRPDNAVIAIVGDTDPETAIALVEQYFGDIESGGPRPVPDLAEELRTAPKRLDHQDPLAQLPAVLINHQAPEYSSEDFFGIDVLETVLLRGTSSRLYRRMIIDEQVAVQVGGGYDAHRGPSLFSVFAVVPVGGSTERVVEVYQEELNRLMVEKVPKNEIQKSINQLRSGKVMGQQSVLNRALSVARSTLYHGDPLWEEKFIERVSHVTPEDLMRLAKKYFSANTRVEMHVTPKLSDGGAK